MEPISYGFEPGKRSMLVELYFPKKAIYQGAIYDALKGGLDGQIVRDSLIKNRTQLYEKELLAYPHWFDPARYKQSTLRLEPLTDEEIIERISKYQSPFYGWSVYEVDGVFLRGRSIAEERTQIIRLIFKHPRTTTEERSEREGLHSTYRALLYFAFGEYGMAGNQPLWNDHHKRRFLDQFEGDERRLEFVERHYARVMRSVTQFLDNCALFVFGYLVRAFWTKVAAEAAAGETELEDEIWISSIFHVSINVVRPIKKGA